MQTVSLVNFSSTGVDLVLYLLDLVSRLKQQDVEDLFMATLQVGTKLIPLANGVFLFLNYPKYITLALWS